MRIGSLTVAIGALLGASSAQTQSPTALHDMPFEQISLQRTECLGSCPSCTVTLHGAGTVVYSGRAYVASTGEHRAQ
ncbi:DUF6438 domain-containing protein [Lysobacter sp. CA199]|uniref:DUF6438 domain-containing protein n=1 Tax=Lysobacter sp. CA199 TaxID=3455608 RepID=UPI003F8D26F5